MFVSHATRPRSGPNVYNFSPSGSTIFEGTGGYTFTGNNAINEGGNGITDKALHEHGKTSVNAYIFLCGLLMSQWCYTARRRYARVQFPGLARLSHARLTLLQGYDASAHMSEETNNAGLNGAYGIVGTILATFAFGLAYIVSWIVSVPDLYNSYNGPFALSYNPAVQILWDNHEIRYANGRYACGLWVIPLSCQFFCTLSSITSNSRMLYAFARDGACSCRECPFFLFFFFAC